MYTKSILPVPAIHLSLYTYLLAFLLLLFPHYVQAQCPGTNTGYVNPVLGLNNASGGTDPWNNPGNALTDNNSYATLSNAALLIGGTVRSSNFLVVRNLGLNIPGNAIICGIQVEIRKFSSDNSSSNWTRDLDIRLLKNNVITGTNHGNTGVNWPSSEAAFTYGTNADLWGTTLTGFDVSNNGFGVAIAVESRAAGLLLPTVISYIDQVRIRVYYYVPFIDIDGDGIADNEDADMDGDGLSNNQELITCTTASSLTLANATDASLSIPQAANVRMAISNIATSGAGISEFAISENYTAVAGSEIKLTQDIVTATDNAVILLKFNNPVHNLRFKVQDVDFEAGQFRDNVTVNIYSGKTLIPLTAANYTLGTGNFNAYTGNNIFEGLAAMDDTELNGSISIHILQMVDSVKLVFKNTDAAAGLQTIAVGEISYCNVYNTIQDIDADGKPGFRDVDSDNDGIQDLYEIQSSTLFIAPSNTDANNNGLDDAYDVAAGGTALVAIDTDADGIPDYMDTDSDDDGNSDVIEGNDSNRNCAADFPMAGVDTDGDGLDNNYDTNTGGTPAPMQDSDGNGLPDYRQNNLPTIADAGTNRTGNNASFTLDANTPINGRGYWTVASGAGVFANINNPTTTVSGLQAGPNRFAWTIYTDGCHASTDTVDIQQLFPLPVTMSLLQLKAETNRVLLSWSTYTEQNNKGFTIMHSTDGQRWQSLSFVASQAPLGNSNAELKYTAYHNEPSNGRNYYRLAQQDMDGSMHYSNIESLLLNQTRLLNIHPNPVSTTLYLSGADAQNIKALKLTDAAGKTVLISGKRVQQTIQLNNLVSGWYIVQITYMDGTEKSSRFLKQ